MEGERKTGTRGWEREREVGQHMDENDTAWSQ